MGQLLNRLWRYAQSEYGSKSGSSSPNSFDEDSDLKRIINELNNDKSKRKDEERKEKSSSNFSVMTEERAFSILGLAKSANIEEIKAAYKQKVKEYHPDRVAALGDELKELAQKKTQQINEAYSFLEKLKGF